MWHITKGYIPPNLRPEVVKLMLSGRGHEDDIVDREEDDKVPVFLEHLRLLKTLLARDTSMLKGEKAATWAVATLAFWGSFRLTEILSSHAKSIDHKIDLLRRDIRIDSRMVNKVARSFMIVCLKSPKEARSNKESIKVEVFAMPSAADLCPVEAFKDYEKIYGKLQRNNAAFRLAESGDCLRKDRFNKTLKTYFQKYSSYGKLTGHSFRSGLSSLLGEAGFTDEEIQALGRWSSSAFLNYVRSGRLQRMRMSDRVLKFVEQKCKG